MKDTANAIQTADGGLIASAQIVAVLLRQEWRRRLALLFFCLMLCPIAQADLFFIHNDQLGTPQAMTDKSGAVVWRAKYDPFGQTTITKAPSAATPIPPDLNLRFPGQYYDAETGLHYNYYRDYDPQTGRYIQSDPIGLAGGINTYSYAVNNSLRVIDPFGLAPPPVAGIPSVALIGVVTRNTMNASKMDPFEFRSTVTNGGDWDYKKLHPELGPFGNYNFGATCAAAGFFSIETCLREAGRRQCINKNSKPEWGSPNTGPPYGDDPNDQRWIKQGWNDYVSGIYGGNRSKISHEIFRPAASVASEHVLDVPCECKDR